MKKTFLFLPVVLLFACNGLKSIKSALSPPSPYEAYVQSLEKAELLGTSMAQQWISAGQESLNDSVWVSLPFVESGFFQASTPEARSYRFRVRDGQVLTINGAVKTSHPAKVFVDLFISDDAGWERVAYADSALSLTYEFNRDQECVLRVQPELLANTYYAVNTSATPVLLNPVFGASNKSIGSFYGAPRDNGRRSHEGVDIFAPKGTPVIAPTDGVVTRVGLNTLGGKVVWMKDPARGHSYYFAHLDSQMVKPGMKVFKGHVLGLVGNTGNARTTPPHLHFGIYQSGSRDPLYYIQQAEEAMASMPVDTGFHHQPFKVARKVAVLKSGPSAKLPDRGRLKRNTYVTVIGQSHHWYRISLPDKVEGFLPKNQLTELSEGAAITLDSASVLFSAGHARALPVDTLSENTPIHLLAHYGDYRFVTTEQGKAGWLLN